MVLNVLDSGWGDCQRGKSLSPWSLQVGAAVSTKLGVSWASFLQPGLEAIPEAWSARPSGVRMALEKDKQG